MMNTAVFRSSYQGPSSTDFLKAELTERGHEDDNEGGEQRLDRNSENHCKYVRLLHVRETNNEERTALEVHSAESVG